jgi:hypothetical protein
MGYRDPKIVKNSNDFMRDGIGVGMSQGGESANKEKTNLKEDKPLDKDMTGGRKKPAKKGLGRKRTAADRTAQRAKSKEHNDEFKEKTKVRKDGNKATRVANRAARKATKNK